MPGSSECAPGDGTKKIFLNTKWKDDDVVSKELAEFLHYIEDSTDVTANAAKSERVKRVHGRVSEVKLNEEIGVKYMQAWEEKYCEHQEGREKGRIETLINLVCKKWNKGFTFPEIADLLEEKESVIQEICDIAARYAPEYDIERITDEYLEIVIKT